jgi:hypothetical protein
MKPSRRRKQTQSGFALLLVFAMAAAAAVMFYLEMPRVAFENMRGKEEMLVERGEQYQRAIQLYVRKNNKYPQTIEDLETTNNIRFLRKRYKDPMTGEEEWRLIHIDNMGQYTDSLIHKKDEEKKKTASVLASNIQGIGESAEYIPNAQGQGTQNPYAMARRPSEQRAQQGQAGASGDPLPMRDPSFPPEQPFDPQQQQQQYQPGQAPGSAPSPFSPPGQMTPVPGGQTPVQQAPSGFGGSGGFGSTQPVNQQGGRFPAFPSQGASSQSGGQLGTPIGASGIAAPPGLLGNRLGQLPAGAQQGQQPGQQTGQPSGQSGGGFGFGGGFGMGSGGQATPPPPTSGGMQGSFPGGQQGSFPGMQQPGQSPSSSGFGGSFGGGFSGSSQPGQAAPNQAIQAIRGILSGGRPNQPQQAGGTGAAIPGGIAGVASKRDMQAIKVYNERSNYKEWEFLFDMKKEMEARGKKANPGTPQMGNQQGQPGQSTSPGFGGQQGQSPTSGFGGFGSGGATPPRSTPGGFGRQ